MYFLCIYTHIYSVYDRTWKSKNTNFIHAFDSAFEMHARTRNALQTLLEDHLQVNSSFMGFLYFWNYTTIEQRNNFHIYIYIWKREERKDFISQIFSWGPVFEGLCSVKGHNFQDLCSWQTALSQLWTQLHHNFFFHPILQLFWFLSPTQKKRKKHLHQRAKRWHTYYYSDEH